MIILKKNVNYYMSLDNFRMKSIITRCTDFCISIGAVIIFALTAPFWIYSYLELKDEEKYFEHNLDKHL